jgi:hypothetical protein
MAFNFNPDRAKKVIKDLDTNPAILADLNAEFESYAGPEGYWRCRGFEEFPGYEELPFWDFFEPTHEPSHKKSFLDETGKMKKGVMHGEVDSLLPLYNGITRSATIIGNAFFMYSNAITNLQLVLNSFSKKYKVPAALPALLAVVNDTDGHILRTKALATRWIAFIGYEGGGALGGYSAEVWSFWSRMLGMAMVEPVTNKKGEVLDYVDTAEARSCQAEYYEADAGGKFKLFSEWWTMGYSSTPTHILKDLFHYWDSLQYYKALERGAVDFELEDTSRVQAAFYGFMRRAAKGRLVATAYSLEEAYGSGEVVPLVDYLMLHGELNPLLDAMLKDYTGGYSVYGAFAINLLNLNSLRSEMVAEVVEQIEAEAMGAPNRMVKRLSQRGNAKTGRTSSRK